MKKIYTMLTLAVLAVALGSCDHDVFYSDLIGRWQLVAIIENGHEYDPIRGEYEEYTFYDNGRGMYLNEFGTRVEFWWDEYGRDRVHIRYSDGLNETLYWRVDGNYLELCDTPSFRTGRLFRYAGRR